MSVVDTLVDYDRMFWTDDLIGGKIDFDVKDIKLGSRLVEMKNSKNFQFIGVAQNRGFYLEISRSGKILNIKKVIE